MTVTLDETIDQLLGSGIVGVGRVCKRSRDQIVKFERDGEWGVGRDGVKVPGGGEFGGRLPAAG